MIQLPTPTPCTLKAMTYCSSFLLTTLAIPSQSPLLAPFAVNFGMFKSFTWASYSVLTNFLIALVLSSPRILNIIYTQMASKYVSLHISMGFPGGSVVKNPPANAGDAGDQCSIPGFGRSLEEEMVTQSSILAWKIPWTEEPSELQSMESQRVGHN